MAATGRSYGCLCHDLLTELPDWLLIDNVMWPQRAVGRTDARDRRRVQTTGSLFAPDGSQPDSRAAEPTVAIIAHV